MTGIIIISKIMELLAPSFVLKHNNYYRGYNVEKRAIRYCIIIDTTLGGSRPLLVHTLQYPSEWRRHKHRGSKIKINA